MLYFAYGSNINLGHLADYLDTHGVTLDTKLHGERAVLHNYRLRTNYFAASHGAGACNIEANPESHVEGVLLIISEAVRDVLRIKEGYPRLYTELDIHVFGESAKRRLKAMTYVVTPEHQLDTDLPVTARYRELILAGTKHFDFTEKYQRDLRRQLKVAPSLRLHIAANVAS